MKVERSTFLRAINALRNNNNKGGSPSSWDVKPRWNYRPLGCIESGVTLRSRVPHGLMYIERTLSDYGGFLKSCRSAVK